MRGARRNRPGGIEHHFNVQEVMLSEGEEEWKGGEATSAFQIAEYTPFNWNLTRGR